MNKQLESFEVTKQLSSTDGDNIEAYLTTWGNIDKVGDIIPKSALVDYVEEFNKGDIKLPMLYSHKTESLIGIWTSLEIDDYGLIGKGEIYTEVSLGADVRALLKRGALDSVSIGFKSSDWEYNEDGTRTFNKLELVETSVVLNPANSQAAVLQVKSEDGTIDYKSLKEVLRKSGLSNKQSEDVIHSVKDHWSVEPQSKSVDAGESLNLGGLLDHINSKL